MRPFSFLIAPAACLWAFCAAAQGPADAGAAAFARAQKVGGSDYLWTANILCTPGEYAERFFSAGARPGIVNTMVGADQEVAPLKVFDNLYYVGTRQVGSWVLETREGLILIDALFPGMGASQIEPAMRALKLDPARIKYVLITHAAPDHWGSARYFQDRYKARVVMGAADWDFVYSRYPRTASTDDRPRRDIVVNADQTVTLGSANVTVVLAPGATPGSLSYIFPVQDHGRPHVAAVMGGIIMSAPTSIPERAGYVRSIEHWLDLATRAGADVELENHPFVGGQIAKLEVLRRASPGQPNPFLIGADAFTRFGTVLRECAAAGLARAQAGQERVPTTRPAR
jgi:metallo-beta-lactamase class B